LYFINAENDIDNFLAILFDFTDTLAYDRAFMVTIEVVLYPIKLEEYLVRFQKVSQFFAFPSKKNDI